MSQNVNPQPLHQDPPSGGDPEYSKTNPAPAFQTGQAQPVPFQSAQIIPINDRARDTLEEEDTIDLVSLFFMLLDNLPYLIMCFLIGALALDLFAFFCIAPTYKSTAKLYIVSASGDNVVDLTDLNIGTSLTNDYEELILSYPVLDTVINKMSLDMTTEDLSKLITLSNPTDTRVLTIDVTTTDKELSKDIANTLLEVAQDYLPETMSTVRPNVAQRARLATKKSGPSYSKFMLIGGLAGGFLCAAWLIFGFLMDDTIHTQEDLEREFDIVPLTCIPYNDQMHQSDDTESRDRHKRKKQRKRKKTKDKK